MCSFGSVYLIKKNIPLENYERKPTPYSGDFIMEEINKDDEDNYKVTQWEKKNNVIYNISFIPLVIYQMIERSIR